jgi:Holliday junction resolvasome RuvABC endonuclease subunit
MERLGYGVVSLNDDLELINFGMINTPRTDQEYNQFLNEGIIHIANEFPKLLMVTEPDIILAEYVPPGKLGTRNELTAVSVAVCRVIAHQWGIEWRGIADSTWKSKVVGKRDATKAQTRNAVFSHFPTMADQHKLLKKQQKAEGLKPDGFPADVTDGIAIAIAGTMIYDIETQERSGIESERETQDSARSLPALL